MSFNNYLEEEDDKPYFTKKSLAYYYEDMERKEKLIKEMAKYIAEYDRTLKGNLSEIEMKVAERLAQWDQNLQKFPSDVTDLLKEWVDDGSIDHIIDTALIDQKVKPFIEKLENKVTKHNLNLVDDFGAKGDANYYDSTTKKYYTDSAFTVLSSDDTVPLLNALAASKKLGVTIEVPERSFLFSQQLLFDGERISFVGIGGKYKATFIKNFAGNGIKITKDFCTIANIRIARSESIMRHLDTGSGVVVGDDTTDSSRNIRANYCYIDIHSFGHGLHGIDCQKGNENRVFGHYDQNFKDGVHCSSEWVGGAADWNANVMEFSAMGNGRHGFYLYRSETNMIKAVVQGNGWGDVAGVGSYINWSGNTGFIYSEGNVNGQVTYGVSGYGNDISMHTVDQQPVFNNNLNVGFVNGTGFE